MSADKHTPTPWRTKPVPDSGFFSVESMDIQLGDYVAAAYSEQDARRIVACVNALAGISTEALEDAVTVAPLHRFGHLRDLMALHHVKAKDCA